jgi:AbrB family looped-hinge helix DNA binding protein
MNAQTRLSAKGQVVIPKDVRDRMALEPGEVFEVVERDDEVVLKRRKAAHSRRTAAEALAEICSFYRYSGPRVSEEEMRAAVLRAVAEDYRRSVQGD